MSEAIEASEFKQDLTELIPHLRAFARSLCNNRAAADDLAQEALLKAWRARASYEHGTNLKAWTFTILRNLFYSQQRRAWRSQPLDQEVAEATLVAQDNPSASLELLELRMALPQLPVEQREALILVGAGGVSYEEAAAICGCAVGTIKSRVSRARKALADILENGSVTSQNDGKGDASSAMGDIMDEADRLVARV
ncbi:sigma-70 family RNA polymerase sigma factor [Parvularcula sp. LCG005]|uniref:sigma-70 family RNA polymerase sigma factor n=1 Tax=Parvularcula sp. LCG005 TaxID=3078805 RepID=UPI00294246B2|nr:sigma-70 family RNA polymerase sigma factor [Parvularcula sp. LCG005]WOI52904.1 sigma-70 family RNA polymerase sigma factor [Parvularcula sp. LCG005]